MCGLLLQIIPFELTLSDYFLAGWKLQSQMNEMTESWLMFPRLRSDLKRPVVEFHHLCGTSEVVDDERVRVICCRAGMDGRFAIGDPCNFYAPVA